MVEEEGGREGGGVNDNLAVWSDVVLVTVTREMSVIVLVILTTSSVQTSRVLVAVIHHITIFTHPPAA